MNRMRKEVSPVVAVVGILVTLAVVQLLYWRGLVVRPTIPSRASPPGGGSTGMQELPPDKSGVVVSTLAGQPEPGYQDGPAEEARFDGPAGIAVAPGGTAPAGLIYVADGRNHRLRTVAAGGSVSTLAGGSAATLLGGYADGPAAEARFAGPTGLALAPGGAILVSDTGNHRIRRVGPDGLVTTYAGAETPKDDLGRPQGGYRDGPAGEAEFRYPAGLAVDTAGNVYVADEGNRCVRRISAAGEVTTVAAAGEMGAPTYVAVTADGRLWVADTAGGTLWVGPREGPLRRWEPAAGEQAPKAPAGLAARGDRLYVVDTAGNRLVCVEGGRVLPLAGDPEGGEAGYADGPGSHARFSGPAALAAGADGSLYLADFGNNCVRRVTLPARFEEGR